MSLKALNDVWSNSDVKGTHLLVLLALADYADDEGLSWPSVTTLAKKARIDGRTVQRILADLEHDVQIVCESRPGRSSLYRILMDPPRGGDKLSPRQSVTPDTHVTPGVTQLCQGGGDIAMSPRTIIEPSGEPSIVKRRQPRLTPLPDNFSPSAEGVAYAAQLGVDMVCERAAFVDHHTAKGSRFVNWDAAWRTWCRNAVKWGRVAPVPRRQFRPPEPSRTTVPSVEATKALLNRITNGRAIFRSMGE